MDNITVELGSSAGSVRLWRSGDDHRYRRLRASDGRGARAPDRHDQLRDPVRDHGSGAPGLPPRRGRGVSGGDPLRALTQLAADEPAWLVGGAVRDRLLGRPTDDYDVVLLGDARRLARALARSTDAHAFALSDAFGVWRVVDRGHRWQVDVLPLVGESIETDLAGRDFTINAIAEPLGGGGHVDPFGGLEDLRARRLRMVSAHAFSDDPLRALRLARLACELGFDVDADDGRVGPGERRRARSGGARAGVRGAEAGAGRRQRARRARADGCDRRHRRRAAGAERSCAGSSRARFTISTCTSTPGWSWPRRSRWSASPNVGFRTRPRRSGGSWPSRSPTSSAEARRCGSGRCCTTWPSRRPGA